MKKILLYGVGIVLVFVLWVVVRYWKSDLPLDELKAKYAPPPSRFVRVQGMDVHYRDEGSARDSVPVVLLHGTGSSLHTWEPCVQQLKDDYRVVTLDLPGYGLTGPHPQRVYSPDFYVGFVADFLRALRIRTCIIGGNSLGGGIAWQFAHAHPTSVAKLILLDAGGYPTVSHRKPIAFSLAQTPLIKHALKRITPYPLAVKSIRNVYAQPERVTDSVVRRHYELFLREGNRQAFIDRMEYVPYPDNASRIRALHVPTLIVWGAEDRLIPIENAYRFQADLPNDTLVIIPGVGHVPMEEDPAATVKAMRLFLGTK
ncbi:MAG: alpha/beta hydrolase [Cyclobacteriaceae bacterium]|jgi:pimeloyl-ACP methyl ester carboxylesterase|nr:alpha/beta hydrolase [Cyclobacteriaceae bacterium]